MTSVEIVIPVYNEENDLARNIHTLCQFLEQNLPYEWNIVIADNASTDGTSTVAEALSKKYPKVSYTRLDQKGRGRALRYTWLQSGADIVSYMDVDLSSNLSAFYSLVSAIEDGYDVAIGSRLMRESRVKRSLKRTIASLGYNILRRAMFFSKITDAQCGFKALSRKSVRELVPLIQNQVWFFDSELLILAETKKYKIKEIPVEWVEDPASTVNVYKTAVEDIKGLLRMRLQRFSKGWRH